MRQRLHIIGVNQNGRIVEFPPPSNPVTTSAGSPLAPDHGRLAADLRLDVYTSPMRDGNGGQFSPTTATLFVRPTKQSSSTPSTQRATSPSWPAIVTSAGRSPRSTSPTPTPTTTSDSNASSTTSRRPARRAARGRGRHRGRQRAPGRLGRAFGGGARQHRHPGTTRRRHHHRRRPPAALNVGQADARTTPCSTSPRSTPSSPATSSTTASTRSSPPPAR